MVKKETCALLLPPAANNMIPNVMHQTEEVHPIHLDAKKKASNSLLLISFFHNAFPSEQVEMNINWANLYPFLLIPKLRSNAS